MKRNPLTRSSRRPMRLVHLALMPAMVVGFVLPAHAADNTGRADGKVPAQQQANKAEARKNDYRGMRADRLIGTSVRNLQGQNIGQISDLIVDMTTGDVRYAVLRFDPGILAGERLFAVPTHKLRMAGDRNDVVFDVKESRLEQAVIDRSVWDSGRPIDRQWIGRIDDLWGVMQPGGMQAHRASDLLGQDVNDRHGNEIGEIDELVVDMSSQKVHYAVFEHDPGSAAAERSYALPLTSFRTGAAGSQLVLELDAARLGTMKPFDNSRYSNLNDPLWVADVDRYLVTLTPKAASGSTSKPTSDTSPRDRPG